MAIVNVGQQQIHYVTLEGDRRESLLLVHGLAASLGFWYLKLAPALARNGRVTMFDLRGHGRSSMPGSGYSPKAMAYDLAALLDALDIETTHVVGHSYGGCVAASFARLFPDRVKSLTIVDSRLRTVQPKIDFQSWRFWSRYRDALKNAGVRMDERDFDFGYRLFEQLATLRLHRPEAMGDLQRVVPTPFSQGGGRVAALRWLKLMRNTTAPADFSDTNDVPIRDLERIEVPILLLYGEHSQALPTGIALHKLWPHSLFEVVPAAGHFFPVAFPDKLTGPVSAFLQGLNRADKVAFETHQS